MPTTQRPQCCRHGSYYVFSGVAGQRGVRQPMARDDSGARGQVSCPLPGPLPHCLAPEGLPQETGLGAPWPI